MSMTKVLSCTVKNEDLVDIAKERTRTEISILISRMIFPMLEAITTITMEECDGTEIATKECFVFLSKI